MSMLTRLDVNYPTAVAVNCDTRQPGMSLCLNCVRKENTWRIEGADVEPDT